MARLGASAAKAVAKSAAMHEEIKAGQQLRRMESNSKYTEHPMPNALKPLDVDAPHAPVAAAAENAARSAPKPPGPVDAAIRKGASQTFSAIKANPVASAVVGAVGLTAGAISLRNRKKRKQQQDQMYGYNNAYSGGDVWENPDGACAALEAKCFNDPKIYGSSPKPLPDDILKVPGLVGRLSATVRS